MSILKRNQYEDGRYKIAIVSAVLILMQFLMVCGRYYSRRLQKLLLQADDYVLTLATLFTVALCAVGIAIPMDSRSGRDIDPTSGGVPHEERVVQRVSIAWMTLYGASVSLSKIAILYLYVRVFTMLSRAFATGVWIMGSFVGVTGLVLICGSIFQCTPIAYNWDKTTQGRCIDVVQFARFMAIPNVITGIGMLILPLPMVWSLHMTSSKKIALTATFLHGIIGVIASIVRLSILFEPLKARDMDSTSWIIWTSVEPANYIIAACLPTLRPVLVRLLPSYLFFLTIKRKSKTYSSRKISWPKSRHMPKIMLATADIRGPSHMTGPWDLSRAPSEDLEANSKNHAVEGTEKSSRGVVNEMIVAPRPVA